MTQAFTSAATSINSGKLPKVFSKVSFPRHRLIFDYGCVKYTDHIRAALPDQTYCPFDPFNQPDDVNRCSVNYVLTAMLRHYPVDVVCSNVLNVIDDDDTVCRIARHIREIVRDTGGTGYVTVYAGDRSGIGRQTGPDQYQRNQPLSDYLKYFPGAEIRSGMIIVKEEHRNDYK